MGPERPAAPASPAAGARVKKKKRLSSISKQSARRLVEYFVVVSSVPQKKEGGISVEVVPSPPDSPARTSANDAPLTDIASQSRPEEWSMSSPERHGDADEDRGDEHEFVDDFDFQPSITARYPLEDHEGNPLHESVTCFCHPSGSIRLRTDFSMPKIHYFVATGGNGQQMYGTCLTLWEPYMISSLGRASCVHTEVRPPQDRDEDSTGADREVKDLGGLGTKREVFLPKCLVLLSTYPYLVAFREYLTQLHRLTKMGDMQLPVERYITNFCAEIPAPPPGSFEVQTTILDSVIKLWSPPFNQPIAWVALPFSHLFECLDLGNVLMVWHALALERQVLLTSTQVSLLTTCCEILLSLLFPMQWSHAYIPVLPHFLIPILSAPMPYLCGIDKTSFADAICDLSGECVVVDLDKNLVTLGPTTPPLPPLPAGYVATLQRRLERNVGMVFREARSLTKSDDFSDRGMHLQPHVKTMSDAMWESRLCLFDEAFHLAFTPEESRKNLLNGNDASGAETTTEKDLNNPTVPIRIMTAAEKQNLRKQSQWDAVQEAFLDTYVYILRNYRKFLVFPSKESEGSYGGAGFRAKDFVHSQRYDVQEFLDELLGTQMFDDFVTKRLYGSGAADVTFFDMAVDRFFRNASLLETFDMGGSIRRAKNAAGAVVEAHAERLDRKEPGRGQRFRKMFSHRRMERNGGIGTSGTPKTATAERRASSRAAEAALRAEGPLLQSARIHRKLKTIVPPEPSCENLPNAPNSAFATLNGGGGTGTFAGDDDASVNSGSTSGTHSTKSTTRTSRSAGTGTSQTMGTGRSAISSPGSKVSRSSHSYMSARQDRLAEMVDKEKKYCYVYPTFPSELDPELFGTPRPMPSAVLAEFDRQRDDAARFRRKAQAQDGVDREGKKKGRRNRRGRFAETPTIEPIKQQSAEVATFTLFFMAFTSVVGKELIAISDNPLLQAQDRTILSTYIHPATDTDVSSDEDDREDDNDDSEILRSGDATLDALNALESRFNATSSAGEGAEGKEGIASEDDKLAKDSSESGEDADDGVADNDAASEEGAEEASGNGTELEGKDGKEGAEKEGMVDVLTKDNASGGSDDASIDKKNEIDGGVDDDHRQDNEVKKDGDIDSWLSPKTPKMKNVGLTPSKERKDVEEMETKPRNRFQDTLSALQLEEAKATAKAQLGLAFEMLTMMRSRNITADPEAYQCLIKACGRCGDTERATQLLGKMHEDGIVADGVVYSSLVTAFSAENNWRTDSAKKDQDLPAWANSASVEMDWNKLQKTTSYLDRAKRRIRDIRSANEGTGNETESSMDDSESPGGGRATGLSSRRASVRAMFSRKKNGPKGGWGRGAKQIEPSPEKEKDFCVTEAVLRQILLGENLLEIVYPDISIDTDNELCPRCNFLLDDGDVVAGWVSADSQDYTTECPNCTQKFVPRFCVQCTSPTFVGSRGHASPLLLERLSPWVLQKELRSVMSDREGIENILSPEWRENEPKNAVLWWNLILSFIRYRFPFSFLLQGSFDTNLISPTPTDDAS